MKYNNKTIQNNYYSGGLAEFVSAPSLLTYSFLKHWFTGKASLGKAMTLLNLPCKKTGLPILVLINDQLAVDLTTEELTLYSRTIFKYKKQQQSSQTPQLTIAVQKVIKPSCLLNTVKILLIQSNWIAKPQPLMTRMQELVKRIPSPLATINIADLESILINEVWPSVIAIGILSEFFNQLLHQEKTNDISQIDKYIAGQMTVSDWFFLSISDQLKVQNNTILFADFISRYGSRADKDYELACPRWEEIPDVLKNRIRKAKFLSTGIIPIQPAVSEKTKTIIHTSIALQILRSDAKRKALAHMKQLRKAIIKKTGKNSDISNITREELLGELPVKETRIVYQAHPISHNDSTYLDHGNGLGVSPGIIKGQAKHISDNSAKIPSNTIGIFPNASPEFAIQYSKCSGMIFLQGGQTSHGAIVAREFGIPAIIEINALNLQDGTSLFINGTTGEWHISSSLQPKPK